MNIKYTAYTNYTIEINVLIFVLLCCFKPELKRSFILGFTFEWTHVWRRLRGCCCKQMVVNLNGYSGAAARQSTFVVSKGFRKRPDSNFHVELNSNEHRYSNIQSYINT